MADGIRADVIVVGAGAASLAAAYSIAAHSRKRVIVLEKGRGVGSHSISGAIIRPGILERLLGGQGQNIPHAEPGPSGPEPTCSTGLLRVQARRLPFGTPVAEDKVVLLTERKYLAFPAPPPIRSKGCLMVCYGDLCRYLAEQCESLCVEVHSELAAEEPIIEGGRVVGVKLLSGETVLADCVVLGGGFLRPGDGKGGGGIGTSPQRPAV